MSNPELLHPELFTSIPVVGDHISRRLFDLAVKDSLQSDARDGVTVVIRTLNEESSLEGLFEDIYKQDVDVTPQVVVVDNESDDRTRDVAKFLGAQVVLLPRKEFTYPRSMNIGVEAADYDSVFLTVGHARFSNTQILSATARALNQKYVGGVFGRVLPSASASRIERLVAIGNSLYLKEEDIRKAGMGVMGATNAAISKPAWKDLGRFDERYESGGEDTALAKQMIGTGLRIVENPLLAVHHSHGLDLNNYYKQWMHWLKTVKGPVPLDLESLKSRRPDLDIS